MLLLEVFQVVLLSFLNLTKMLQTEHLNTCLLEVIISFKLKFVFICDLSDLTLQIVFDAWWASMKVG
jgi:hypothetical protein